MRRPSNPSRSASSPAREYGGSTTHSPDAGAPPVEVVALVASAGGLEAISAVLRDLPKDLPATVLVAQHLSGQGSMLVGILERRTDLPVDWADDGAELVPGRVMVARPRTRLEILPDRTCAVSPVEGSPTDRPFDALLTSLAESIGEGAVATVLSGMGSDAAEGAMALKASGGIVIAQSEDTAAQPSMPHAAAAAGADLVLSLHEIGGVVGDLVRGGPLPRATEELEAIHATFGRDGEIAALAADIDWSAHPLGPVRSWPASMRQLVRLVMESPDPSLTLWRDQQLMIFNDAAVPTFGDRAHEAFGRPYLEAFPEIATPIAPIHAQVLGGERVRLQHAMIPYRRGPELQDSWFDVSYLPIRTPDGDVEGIYVVWFERTQEVLASRRLETLNRLAGEPAAPGRRQALERALEILATSADIGFAAAYLLDTTVGRASLVRAVGVEEGGALAPHDVRLTSSPWPFDEVVQSRRAMVVEGVAARFRGHVVGAEQLAPQRVIVQPLRDEAEDRVVGVLLLGASPRLAFDELYRAFLALAGETIIASVAESQARTRERQRVEQAAAVDRAKTEFFANVSQEFRTPLTLMLGSLEEMLDDPASLAPGREVELELMAHNTRRLLRLVGTMLDFSQIEAGGLRARFAPTDLSARTREIAERFETAAQRAGLELRIDVERLPSIWVDVAMWEKIVSNLVSNALKFTFEGRIEVKLRALPQHIELVVRDTGTGIPTTDVPFIFKRFHHVEGARARSDDGAGIGLALVDQLVRAHHGRIRVSSEEGRGTTFTVWIPRGHRPEVGDAASAAPALGGVSRAMAEEAERWDPTAPSTEEDVSDVTTAPGGPEQRPRRPGR
jgi:signal transduction histidine kinase